MSRAKMILKKSAKIIPLVLALSILFSMTMPIASASHPFGDVQPGRWYAPSVAFMYAYGIMGGVTDTEFRPTSVLTRGEYVTFLHRLAGEPRVNTASPFVDARYTWLYNAAVWATEVGITTGLSDGTFRPHFSIERQQVMAILHRFATHRALNATVPAGGIPLHFVDRDQVLGGAYDAVAWAVYHGFMGVGTNTLGPTGNVTRAETAVLLHRFVDRFSIPAPVPRPVPVPTGLPDEVPQRSISLTGGTMTFPAQTAGYTQLAALSTVITNTDDLATEQLTVTAPTGFQVSSSQAAGFSGSITVSSIAVGGTATFWTRPALGLTAGTHTGNVTVASTTAQTPPLEPQTRAVSFTVSAAQQGTTPPSSESVSDGLDDALETGDPIVLEEDASTVITAEDLQTIRESDAEEVQIELPNGLTITISDIGENVRRDIDLNLEVTITERATDVNNVRFPANSIVIAPAASGEFGFTLSFDISAQMLAEAGLRGDNVRLFHISSDGVVTEQDRVRRNADGSVTISIDRASRFVLSETVPIPPAPPPINFPGVTRQPIPLGAIPFDDVNADDWFAPYVAWAVPNRITTGITGTNNFAPHNDVTRAEFVTFLHRVMGTPAAASGVRAFSDVSAGTWYANAVAWASSVRIIQVTGDRFRPHDDVTRQEMATFLHRFANHVGANTTASADAFNAFPDRGDVAGWARNAKIWTTDNEIITGNRGRLLPQDGANRAEALAIIYRFVELVT